MKATLSMLNQMQADGVIGRYAIGGAVGATFYLEPAATLDVDVFVLLPVSGSLATLRPIYEYLGSRGCRVEAEHIIIGDWPVQFLPPADALEEEALREAQATEVEGVPTWVMTAEHLVAIALKTGRAKDFSRIVQFLEGNVMDAVKLNEIIDRHGLTSKWQKFGLRYRND